MPPRRSPCRAAVPMRDEAAHRVADDDRAVGHVGVVGDGEDLVGPVGQQVLVASAGVAVAGQVHGDDPVVVGQERDEEAPPVGVGRAAVDEDQAGRARRDPRPGS